MTCPPQVDRARRDLAPVQEIWDGVLRRLSSELAPLVLDAWIGPLVAEVAGDGLRLVCPSAFHRERIRERHLPRIAEHVATLCGRALPIALEVASGSSDAPDSNEPPLRPRVFPARPASASPAPPAEARGRLGFGEFAVGPGNALAREAAMALAQRRQLAVSPLYVVAASGLGKTHLANAVVAEVGARGERAVYVSGEQFTNELLTSIRSQRTGEFKRRYRDCDVLVFEDVHFLRAKHSTQLELLHTMEHLGRTGARLMLTSDRLPREIPDFDPRLASRLASGLVAEIEAPDPELRRAILRAKATARGVSLPPACAERLVEAIPASVRDLEAALVQLVASASLLARPIDPALVELALRKVLPRGSGAARLDPERVAALVAAHFDTTQDALCSRSRRRDVLAPRQIAMYLCARYTDASLERIGRAFGRNHPSVANAVRAVERAVAARAPLAARVEPLAAELDALCGRRKGPRRATGGPLFSRDPLCGPSSSSTRPSASGSSGASRLAPPSRRQTAGPASPPAATR
jgi:chromosomal replication initiator protein